MLSMQTVVAGRSGRVVEGGGLENRWVSQPRGFESYLLRHEESTHGEMAE